VSRLQRRRSRGMRDDLPTQQEIAGQPYRVACSPVRSAKPLGDTMVVV
jgi:hypothetical protein